MKSSLRSLVLGMVGVLLLSAAAHAQRRMETLGRGTVAVPVTEEGAVTGASSLVIVGSSVQVVPFGVVRLGGVTDRASAVEVPALIGVCKVMTSS